VSMPQMTCTVLRTHLTLFQKSTSRSNPTRLVPVPCPSLRPTPSSHEFLCFPCPYQSPVCACVSTEWTRRSAPLPPLLSD
ncbi:hypothetical protein B0O80DRAFT_442830, partial [Mortierella sp. GBAus27b]